jgi:hypothetical protein
VTHGRGSEGVAGEWSGYTTSEHGVYSVTTADAHTSAASSRLNWRPRRFKWTRPIRRKTKSGFCACAITFQTQSNASITWLVWLRKRNGNFAKQTQQRKPQVRILRGMKASSFTNKIKLMNIHVIIWTFPNTITNDPIIFDVFTVTLSRSTFLGVWQPLYSLTTHNSVFYYALLTIC